MPSIISLMVGDSSPLVYLSIKKLCAFGSPRAAAFSAAKIGRSGYVRKSNRKIIVQYYLSQTPQSMGC